MRHRTIIEPFKIKSVEPISVSTEAQRTAHLAAAHYNPFLLDSDQVMMMVLFRSCTGAASATLEVRSERPATADAKAFIKVTGRSRRGAVRFKRW